MHVDNAYLYVGGGSLRSPNYWSRLSKNTILIKTQFILLQSIDSFDITFIYSIYILTEMFIFPTALERQNLSNTS